MLKNASRTISKLCESPLISVVTKRSAGHSKWQNIRHIKGAKDAQRSQLFTKLGRQIKVAVQEGGSADPSKNLKLEQVIEQTKRFNMPAATLQSILKSCQVDSSQGKSHLLEIKGPGSCFILCEVFTHQLHQVKQTMATVLKKHQSKFGDGGGLHLFEEKGVIEAQPPKEIPTEDLLETATDHAIESGAEEVEIVDETMLQFICGKSNLKQVAKELERLKYQVESASVEYLPLKMQNLSEKDLDLSRSLCEKLENMPEVVRLSDNIS